MILPRFRTTRHSAILILYFKFFVGIFSPDVLHGPAKELSEKARNLVWMYTSDTKHKVIQPLIKQVEENPDDLFLIVADEAHIALTRGSKKGQMKKERSVDDGDESDEEQLKDAKAVNDAVVNSWSSEKHPNMIILQVMELSILHGAGNL